VTQMSTAGCILRRVSQRATFPEQLRSGWRRSGSLLGIGFDPLPDHLPDPVSHDRAGVLRFCLDIADAVGDLACAFKPQFAHFAALGAEAELATLIRELQLRFPDVPVILDAKRGDIGATAERYAVEAFERYGADAVTVNPYLGPESIKPFLAYQDRGVIVLCRTSNPDSGWLQDYPAGDPVHLRVARAAAEWNANGNVMLVTGATYPEQLEAIRNTVGDMALLVPGIGAQGGDVDAAVAAGLASNGQGLVFNTSRAVLYAASGANYADAARRVAETLHRRLAAAREACAVT
jgi:orotidine-5'-phosphate decarboxylase